MTPLIPALERSGVLGKVEMIVPEPATIGQLRRVHTMELIEYVHHLALRGGGSLDHGDTYVTGESYEAARLAAGACAGAVDQIMIGNAHNGFALVRPPGHHAETDRVSGFCIFNNAAVAARQAQVTHGAKRVAIVDYDVHHGNGTQDIFWREPRVLYASSHQSPLYPGTGASEETGVGNIVNAPLPPEAGSAGFRAAFEQVLLPELDAFAPQLVLISAGFDAHRLDPLANLNLEAADYGWVTRQLVELARRHAGGRVVSSLEGGYSLDALRQSSAAHVAALLG